MMRAWTPFLIAALLLTACGEGEAPADAPARPQADSTAAPAPMDLSAHEVPLLVTPPDPQQPGWAEPAVTWNEDAGVLEVRAGEHFALDIVEGEGDLARLKADLQRDMLRKNEVLEEGPDHLLYRSTYPDRDLVFVHFVKVFHAAGRTFEAVDDPMGRFTEEDVRRMLASVALAPAS